MYINAAGLAAAVGHYRQCLPDSDDPPKGTPPHYQDTGETVISDLVSWSVIRGLAGVKAPFNGVDDLICEKKGLFYKSDSPGIKACMLNSAGATVSISEAKAACTVLCAPTGDVGIVVSQVDPEFRLSQIMTDHAVQRIG